MELKDKNNKILVKEEQFGSNSILIDKINNMFDDIDYYLNYYTEFLNSIFKGSKHNEHYKIMKSLTNELNEIKYLISGGER